MINGIAAMYHQSFTIIYIYIYIYKDLCGQSYHHDRCRRDHHVKY